MDPTIFGRLQFLASWYPWPAVAAFAVAAASAVWVFYDSHNNGVNSLAWRVVAVLSMILIIPSVVLGLIKPVPANAAKLAVVFAWMGIAGVLAALTTLVMYGVARRAQPSAVECPTCHQMLDPSWGSCPYCAQRSAAESTVVDADWQSSGEQQETELVEPPAPSVVEELEMHDESATIVWTKGIKRPDLAWLVCLSGIRSGKPYPLAGERTNIGRGGTNDIVVEGPYVGQQHACIRLIDGEFILYDLGAVNKTFVNGEEVLKQVLHDGDKVAFADAEFHFMRVSS